VSEDGPVTTLQFDCPRCHRSADESFYGPCRICRDDLRSTVFGEQREVEVAAYEPKVNVVPNQIATKE
jgi:hypothetical protein